MKKSFGQHFLKNQSIAEKIVDLADLQLDDFVIEVGPGSGVLTKEILKKTKNLVLIEADEDLIDDLNENFQDINVIVSDAVKVDYDEITKGERWKFISNLPYNAGNAILMKVLTSKNPPEKSVVMVQREVAQRMIAQAGEMSLLSVAVQMYTDPNKVFDVKQGSFVPPPNVMSSVIELNLDKKNNDPESVIKIAKIGFKSRRKQLHKNLSDGGIIKSDELKQILLKLGLSTTSRAQELSTANWVRLQNLL